MDEPEPNHTVFIVLRTGSHVEPLERNREPQGLAPEPHHAVRIDPQHLVAGTVFRFWQMVGMARRRGL